MNIIGEVKLWAGEFEPAGWTFCDGKALLVSDFLDLYSVIGQTYANPSLLIPSTYFRVPCMDNVLTKPYEPRGIGDPIIYRLNYIICYEGYMTLEQRVKNYKLLELSPDTVQESVTKLDSTFVEKKTSLRFKGRRTDLD